jgi:hypothetical protein
MKKFKLLVIMPLLLLAPFIAIQPARAQTTTGSVCITDPSVFDCNTLGIFRSTSLAVGTKLTVAVNIQNSNFTDGYNIFVQADPTVLRGSSVDMCTSNIFPPLASCSGIILPSTRILAICIDGVLKGGNSCSPQDALGVVHVGGVVLNATTIPALNGPFVTGRLFTITYDIVGTTPGITIGYVTTTSTTSCSGTSVANTCVTILAGLNPPASETVSTAPFTNLNDLSVTASPSSQSFVPLGHGSATVTVTALGLFSDTVTVTVSPLMQSGLTTSVTGSTSFMLSNGGISSLTLGFTSTSNTGPFPQTFSVSVTATGTASGISHTTTITIIVSPPDFTLTASPTSLNIPPGSSDTSTITVGRLSGFTDPVTLTPPTVAGLTVGLSPALISGSATTATLSVSTSSSTVPGTYTVTVTGTASSGIHTVSVSVVVPPPDFDINPVPNVESEVPAGVSGSSVIHVDSLNNFQGSVTLNATVISNGVVGAFVAPTFLLNPPRVSLLPGQTVFSTLTVFNAQSLSLGNYTVIVTGNSTVTVAGTTSKLVHSNTFNYTLVDFSASISKTVYIPTPGPPTSCFRPGNTDLYRNCRDAGVITVNSLGGATGWGASEAGSAFIGYNCVNTQINRIRQDRLTCVDYQEYWPNGSLVPRSAIISGLAPLAAFAPRFAFPVPDNSQLCLKLSIVTAFDPILGLLNGFSGNNLGNQTNLPPGSIGLASFIDPTTGLTVVIGPDQGFPGSTGLPCFGFDQDAFRTYSFPNTIPGVYQVTVSTTWSVLTHSLGNMTIIVPQAPEFSQLHFSHHLFFAKQSGQQTVVVGIFNPNSNIGLNAFVRATLVSGTVILTGQTSIVALAVNQTINNLAIVITLSPTMIGRMFDLSVVIVWAPDSKAPRATSTDALLGIPTSGTFTVFP